MNEKEKDSPSKKRSKKRTSKKQAQIIAFTIGILLILLVLLALYLYFYGEGRILFVFPGLAKEVTFTDLLESPNAYEKEWIKIKGRLQYTFSQRSTNVAELLPGYYPSQPGDSDIGSRQKFHNKGSEENYFKIFLEAAGSKKDKSFYSSSIDSGKIVEVVGISRGLDQDHKNVMKLKVVTVMGYRGVIDWLGFFVLIPIALLGIGMGTFFIYLSLGMYSKERKKRRMGVIYRWW
ncbi:MAG: hypothetical protein JSV88_08675 [Candidatus Aminicenantes bacterium]|nr:MAG: hypothetical protein JSV88_08675 [Candidatus Aminicenantes bacterium]